MSCALVCELWGLSSPAASAEGCAFGLASLVLYTEKNSEVDRWPVVQLPVQLAGYQGHWTRHWVQHVLYHTLKYSMGPELCARKFFVRKLWMLHLVLTLV